jgi:hypothetical protein
VNIYFYDVVKYNVTVKSPKAQFSDLHMAPGSLLQSIVEYDLVEQDYDSIVVEHRVNGRLLPRKEMSKTALDLLYCRPSLKILGPLVNLLTFYNVEPLLLLEEVGSQQVLKHYPYLRRNRVIDWQNLCLTGDMFGLHQLHVIRKVSNPDGPIGPSMCHEPPVLAVTVMVIPSFPGLLGSAVNSSQKTYFEECWENNVQLKSRECKEKHKNLVKNIDWYIYEETVKVSIVLVVILLLGPVILIVWYIKTLVYLLKILLREAVGCSLSLLTPVPFVEMDRSRIAPEEYDYDAFLGYAEEDANVAREVTSVLSSFGLRCFDGQRDVPGNQQPTAVWDAVLERCRSVVVMASHAYFTDGSLCIQFRSIHDCLMHQQLSSRRLLLLRVNGCSLPPSLGPLPVADLSKDDWQQRVEWWVLAAEILTTHHPITQPDARLRHSIARHPPLSHH